MITKQNNLYAIYKNGNHLGNERGTNCDDAVKNYLIAFSFKEFLNDTEFVSNYSGKTAIKNTHYY